MHHIRRTSIVFLAIIAFAACLATQPDFFRLGWDKATNPYELPDWFEGADVQAKADG